MTDLHELAPALVAAQGEFSAVPKTAENPFFHSKYADLATVVTQTQPILFKHGLAVAQFPTVLDGEPALKTYLIHKSGQFLCDTMRLQAAKQDPQGQGAAITYARRFAYQAVLGLVADEDDDGNQASQAKAVERQPKMSPADKARADLAALCKKGGMAPSKAAQRFADDYGIDIREADSETVRAFVQVIGDEIAVDNAMEAQ